MLTGPESARWVVQPCQLVARPSMLDTANMPPKKTPNKPVQISLPPTLLKKIDANEETKARGRSAFIIAAVLRYLRDQERERVDQQFAAALGGREDELYSEVEPFLAEQAWPPEDQLVEVGRAPATKGKARARAGR